MNVSTSTHASASADYAAKSRSTNVSPTTTAITASSSSGSTSVRTDTETISNTAKVALAEAMKTAAQTSKEAQSGDHQAINALAKQAQSHASHSVPAHA